MLIGTSTGGPAALDVVLPQLPPDFPWPVLVAQHLPASFTGAFARRLDRECHLDVVEVNQPMPLKPGTIYIGKGDADVMVAPRASRCHRDASAGEGQLFVASERGTHGRQRA